MDVTTKTPDAEMLDGLIPPSSVPEGKGEPYRIRIDDPSNFSTRRVTPIFHNFSTHPLLQLPRLQRLAESLVDTGQCKFLNQGVKQSSPFITRTNDRDGRTIKDVFEHIEEPGSWIALYSVQSDPEYRKFVWDALASVRNVVDPQEPETYIVDGFIFISAPPSVTPFHIDRENNFWLQIRGRKHTNVWQPNDRAAVSEDAIEDFIVDGDLSKVILDQKVLTRSFAAELGPGEGVYMPSTSAHMTQSSRDWVGPGNTVSISIGLVFYTAVTRRSANIYALNRMFRRLGLHPRPPGESAFRDRLKFPLAWTWVRLHQLLRGYQPRKGM